jgi:hypothetical protein
MSRKTVIFTSTAERTVNIIINVHVHTHTHTHRETFRIQEALGFKTRPTLKGFSGGENFFGGSKYVSRFAAHKLYYSFSLTTFPPQKNYVFQTFRPVRNNTSILSRALIFSSKKCEKKRGVLKVRSNKGHKNTHTHTHTSFVRTETVKLSVYRYDEILEFLRSL